LSPAATRRLETVTGLCRIARQGPVPVADAVPYRAYLLNAALGECPVWWERRGVMLALDIERCALHVIDLGSARCRTLPLPGRATALVPAGDDRFIAAIDDRLVALLLDDPELRIVGELARLDVTDRVFNDAKTDRAGRVWAGSRHCERLPAGGALWRYEPERGLVMVDQGYTVANGITLNPSGDRLHVADSRRRVIVRYALGPEGAVDQGDLFAELRPEEGAPDGLTADTQGGIWTALWDGGALRRYAPDGGLERVLELPVSHPTSCMFGGPDLATLFVTSADPATGRGDGVAPSLNGAVFAIDTGFVGVPEAPARLPRSARRESGHGAPAR
jgi:sugar lactone lactonase YvrE